MMMFVDSNALHAASPTISPINVRTDRVRCDRRQSQLPCAGSASRRHALGPQSRDAAAEGALRGALLHRTTGAVSVTEADLRLAAMGNPWMPRPSHQTDSRRVGAQT